MSARVEDQLRDYFAAVDAGQDRITVDELETREPDEALLSNAADLEVRFWRRRHWSVGALTVAAVALLVFTLAAITRDETGSELIPAVTPPTEPAITTNTIAATTTVPIGSPPAAPDPEGPPGFSVIPTVEPAVTSTVPEALEVTWSRAQWAAGEGPFVHDVVAASSFLLGTDRNGRLWRSADGADWERVLGEMTGVSVAAEKSLILVAGRRSDGTTALLRSDDASSWTEVDHSALGLGPGLGVAKTTPSGLTWFAPGAQGGSGAGVLAVVSGDRITEVHDPPWDPRACCGVTDLIDVGGSIAAYQFDRNEPQFSHQWEYLGHGEWSETMDVTFSSDHAVVGETVLMFDQTNATCCGNPIPGTSPWPLLASSDGIDWIEVAQIPGDDVHTLHVNAGSSFWIYGPSIGGGGGDIEVNPDANLRISRDGVTWQRIDISQVDVSFTAEPVWGFVHVAGNTIFLGNSTAYEGPGEYWVATIDGQ